MNKLLGSIISKFDAEAKNHMERQSLNPFSGSFSRSPSPRLSKDQYGRPLAGSKTEERGQKAKCHILREILDLCNCIHDLGVYNKVHKPRDDSDDEEEPNDEEIIITFGEIFQMYTKINDKVVGLLIAAKKRGFLFFEKEILFQRRDDDVLIALIKPISEIRAIINRELKAASSPVPTHSRDDSPVVGSDSESDKPLKTLPNGIIEGSSKSGSGSPVENKGSGPKNDVPKEVNVEKVSQLEPKNEGSENEAKNETPKEVDAETVSPPETVKEDIPLTVENEHSETVKEQNNSAIAPVDVGIALPEIIAEKDESDNKEKQEKDTQPDLVPQAEPQTEVEERIIPSVEVTCDDSGAINDESLPSVVGEPATEQSIGETIPTIEITKAQTPERSASEEPSTCVTDKTDTSEPKADEVNIEIDNAVFKSNETHMTPTVTILQNEDLSMEPDGIIEVSPIVLSPEEHQQIEENLLAQTTDSENADIPVLQTVDDSDRCNQISVTLLNDNERKRTFSNEELIESLTAALNVRSSSPDPCDEEVELIFQSQAAINPLFCDPLQDIHVIPDTYAVSSNAPVSGDSMHLCDNNINLCVSETSDEFKTPISEVITDLKTPEISATPEVIFCTPENANSPLVNTDEIAEIPPLNQNINEFTSTIDAEVEIKPSQDTPLVIEPNPVPATEISMPHSPVTVNEVPTEASDASSSA